MRDRIVLMAFCFSLTLAGVLFSQPASPDSSPGPESAPPSSTSGEKVKLSAIDEGYAAWDAKKNGRAMKCLQKLLKAFNSNNTQNVRKLLSYKAQKTWGKDLEAWKKSGDLLKIGQALKERMFINEWRGSIPITTIFVDGKTIAVMLKEERTGVYKLGLLYNCTDGFDQRDINVLF